MPEAVTGQGAGETSRRPGEYPSREERIVEMWAKGLSYRAIGREVGMRDRAVSGLISRLRAQGWDLPPRR